MTAPFAVRVTLTTDDGSTCERTYVRPPAMRLSRDAFASFALGDLIRLSGYAVASFDVTPVTPV
jgi:hypothetical protein